MAQGCPGGCGKCMAAVGGGSLAFDPPSPSRPGAEMSDPRIAVQVDRDERAVDAGTTAGDLFDGDKVVVAARVNGVLRDLAHVVEEGDVVEPVALDSDD